METTDPELNDFLSSSRLLIQGDIAWGDMPLRISFYLNHAMPPLKYISSVRAIVFRDDTVLAVRNERDRFYIVPGGTVEEGEMPEETLRREMLEETGWTLKDLSILGFQYFHHLGPKPAGYSYPYPDFIWLIYTAQAENHFPASVIFDQYVRGTQFHPIDKVKELHLEEGEVAFFEAAVKNRTKLDS